MNDAAAFGEIESAENGFKLNRTSCIEPLPVEILRYGVQSFKTRMQDFICRV